MLNYYSCSLLWYSCCCCLINNVAQKTYTVSNNNGEKVEEDVDISVNGNFVQYHVNDDDTEVWVVDDFNSVSC